MKLFLEQIILQTTAVFIMATDANAVLFTTFHSFDDNSAAANSYNSQLVLSGQALFGTTSIGGNGGGAYGYGTIFKVNTDGSGYVVLYNFTNGTDGASPMAGMVISSNTLYGTTSSGGGTNGLGYGTIFKINTDGTDFTNLYSFTNSYGPNYPTDLFSFGNLLYGTTRTGDLFSIKTDGSDFTNFYEFNMDGDDGEEPNNLILYGDTLYGTTSEASFGGWGNIFKVNVDGTGFMVLHDFTATELGTNDGGYPQTGLVLDENTLYGTAEVGGNGYGVIFKFNINAGVYTNLYAFTNGVDGAWPRAGLILSGNTLYGTTAGNQGTTTYGTIFKANIDGTGFTNLYNFTATTRTGTLETNTDGVWPDATLVLSDNTLYGATLYGGASGAGTVFALSLGSIPLKIQMSGTNTVLTWGNPAFFLQAAPTVTGTYTNIPNATSPYTNIITGSQQFFRLQAN
jgi:uncharacterized repeat protein (TIGR03803 family)